ncbi:unnamed protein product [Pleuronectes platessa]|uniref:Uncharacterized protein n=1 Tax=Pleuronectes platessa TaxID=8262 RepID=A0A9N7U5Q2_PLEPL|nr:unnamed protein product [Pleuronectes platessa]
MSKSHSTKLAEICSGAPHPLSQYRGAVRCSEALCGIVLKRKSLSAEEPRAGALNFKSKRGASGILKPPLGKSTATAVVESLPPRHFAVAVCFGNTGHWRPGHREN